MGYLDLFPQENCGIKIFLLPGKPHILRRHSTISAKKCDFQELFFNNNFI